jgi:hypothetical protein
MSFNHFHYSPCLRWKQGEYQAISHLSPRTKKIITPLIEVPERGYDFESGSETKSIDEHVDKFAHRVLKKWGKAPFFYDLKHVLDSENMSNGQNPLVFLTTDLKFKECSGTPVTGLSRGKNFQQAMQESLKITQNGVCFRISFEEAADSNLAGKLESLIQSFKLGATNCDLILDLESPNFIPLEGIGELIFAIVKRLPHLKEWRSFTILATSFPSTMAEVKYGQTLVPRHEWPLYKLLTTKLAKANIRIPTFGDYTINHPDIARIDMRLMKPSATIRYTIDDGWLIIKGKNVRDHGRDQYIEHCSTLVSSAYYYGKAFSRADEYIQGCANRTESTGNLSTWRWVGTNHHLEKVTKDVSNFFGSSGKF